MKTALRYLLAATFVPLALGSNWTQFGGDSQRTFVVQQERALTKRSVRKLRLHWQVKLDNRTKELNSLTVPLVASNLKTPHGERTYIFIAGSDDNVFALDAASGTTVWKDILK